MVQVKDGVGEWGDFDAHVGLRHQVFLTRGRWGVLLDLICQTVCVKGSQPVPLMNFWEAHQTAAPPPILRGCV